MRHAGDHLQRSPLNDRSRFEDDDAGSLTENDPITSAQQTTKIGINQESTNRAVSRFIQMDELDGAAHPRSQGAGWAGIGE